jgi:nicotinamide mononucleotide (NMN) deamidase PncC
VDAIDAETAQATAEAARRSTGAELALAVLSTMESNVDMYQENTGQTAMAVSSEKGTTTRAYSIGGMGELAQNWTIIRALDLIRRALLD